MTETGFTTFPDDVARAVFDIAIHSMDFGSGFLDTEQVERLREMALLLGVDPREATPEEHRRRYCTGHIWKVGKGSYGINVHYTCEVCGTYQYSDKGTPDVRLGIPS